MWKYLKDIDITSSQANRSWLKTNNMTSATPNLVDWTTFKLVKVNENWEFVVDDALELVQPDWQQTDSWQPDYIQNKPVIQYADYWSLPVTGDTNIIYVTQDTNVLYRRDETTSTYVWVTSSSDSWIIYSLSDWTQIFVTIWNRGLASAWSGADKTYETSQTIDPVTGHTTNQTFTDEVNFDWATVNSEDTTYNNTNDTVNNENVTETNTNWTTNNVWQTINNDTDTEINNNGTEINNTNTTENNSGVTENYDSTSITNNNGNTINNNETITNNTDVTENRDGDNIVNLTENSSITNNLDGTVTNNLWDTYVENNVYEAWATINNEWDVNINYNEYTENNTHTNTVINNEWNVTNNYEDYIENNTYDSTTVINHDGGTHNYNNTEITYDNTTNVNYEGNTSIDNLTVNNVTFPWGNVFVNGIGNWEVTDEAVSEYSLVATPMSEGSVIVWADSGTGLFPLAPASDYTYDVLLNKITFSTPLGTGERAYVWILSWNANANLGWVSYTETFTATAGQTEFNLSDTPAWEDWIWVSTRSWLYGKLGSSLDYEYDSVTNKIILPAQDDWDVIQVRYIGFVNPIPPVTEFTFDAVELNTWTHNAETNEYILVTYTGWDTIINLPDASLNNGKQIKIKKFTGEDVLTTTILPHGTQLIDGFTWATMNINRTMYTFTAINGNWYLGD